ncbi:MAG: EamA family transporter [Lachnospiraceae bacterium]|jgi:drug/metabolite transporter (DMT)-like permease|nr:EamA family transporter [Lachnospiraceae bacterium]MCI1328548.1 EamA family transporter [Lachnospiraceae bacterium]
MTKTVALYSLFILFGTFISAISQVMLKKAAMKTYPSKIREYLNPLVISAYLIFIVATLCSVIAYRGVPLSLGPVLEATSYIYVTIFGVKIFHEKVNRKKILALVLIIAGIVVAAV